MAKARSPGYPTIGLKEAIDKVSMIYKKDYTNAISPTVAAEHMGYRVGPSGVSGTALGALSALKKYGLLEGRGDGTRVSDAAVTIIAHVPGAPERVAAIREAALKPDLFADLERRFPGGRPSDQAIRSYLLTQKFIPVAADAAIRAYRETKQLVDAESAGYDPATEAELIEEAIATVESGAPAQRRVQQPTSLTGEPYRVSIVPGGLSVVGWLNNNDDIDSLIRILEAGKLLLRPVESAKPPVKSPGDELLEDFE